MKSTEAAPQPAADPNWDSAWAELRQLLVGPEREELGELQRRLGSRDEQIETVAEVLPPAMERSARRGPEFRRSLEPVVREVVQLTLKHDAPLLVDAVLPIIGTLIRKYISAALQDFVDAINLAQEKSLSARSLRWRAEAWRTGKPFADVVLANSVLYRVEQVFLIHRRTGLLLVHKTASGVVAKDADMVSGMLTAIGDFARDSFQGPGDDGGELSTVQIGELRIWVRHGAHAALAAVVRGVAPPDLKVLLDRQLTAIEKDLGPQLERYDGDPSKVESAAPRVAACLVGRGGTESRGNRTIFAAAAILLAVALAAGGLWWRDYSRWQEDLRRLRAEPGYAVTEAKRGWFQHTIEGLRDPLAPPVQQVLGGPSRYEMRFDPFVSLHPKMVWLRDVEPAKKRVEASTIEFAVDSSVLDDGSVRVLATEIGNLASRVAETGGKLTVAVTGSADPTGDAQRNEKLASSRAAAVTGALVRAGVDRNLLEPATAQRSARDVRFSARITGGVH